MIERLGTIRNPLTIIAMFAALAEISGTAVLPFISESNQATYVWFLILFPIVLILLFFATLNFNHKVLYAPSDFANEDNFLKLFQAASGAERNEKLRAETSRAEAPTPVSRVRTSVPAPSPSAAEDLHARYLLVEELVLNSISKELGHPVQRGVRLTGRTTSFVFDGLVTTDKKVIGIEVKYIRNLDYFMSRFRDQFTQLVRIAESLPDAFRGRFSLILAVATDRPSSQHAEITDAVRKELGVTPFPVDIRIFDYEELRKDLERG